MNRIEALDRDRSALMELGLSPEMRASLIARLAERRSHKEIAASAGITAAASRQRQWRARRKLAAGRIPIPR